MGIAKIAGKIIDDLAKLMGKDIISLGDAAVGDVKSGKTFYAGSTTLKTGTLPTKTIVAGAETYEEGYHAGNPGGLSAVDADLAVENIKKDVNIFGKVGTLETIIASAIAKYERTGFASEEWVTVRSTSIPASVKSIVAMNTTSSSTDLENRVRALYNEVEKYLSSNPECLHVVGAGHFNGLGIEATLKLDHWSWASNPIAGGYAVKITY